MAYENYERWKNVLNDGEVDLSIIIPAYNEAERIIPTIGAIASYVSDLGFSWELLIADDGSKDKTVALVEGLGFVNLHVVPTAKNTGKGGAVKRGMMAANGRLLLFSDADNSTPIEELSKLKKKIEEEGYDIAVGSRAAAGAEEGKKSVLRHILSGGLRTLVTLFFNVGVRDTQCGFKLFSREAGKKLHQLQTIEGFSFDLEILYLAGKFGYRIAEVPVVWIDAPGSKVDTTKEIQRFLRDLVKVKINDWQGKYNE